MDNKLFVVMFTLSFTVSLALAQTDEATATVINDETQARLRVNHCVFGGPNVDVLINGEIAVNGGVPQTNQEMGVTGYLYLTPGTYSVAAVPTGEGVEEALMEAVDVSVEAGHRYTVAVMGQADEPSHEALVIDETAAYQEIGTLPTENAQITINNIRGVSGMDFSVGGQVRNEDVPYGGFKAAIWPVGPFTGLEIGVSGDPEQVFDSTNDTIYNMPGTDYHDCFGGTYPGPMGQNFDTHSSPYTSTLNTADFLQVQSDVAAEEAGHTFTFNTFLNAVETAGLSDLLTTGSPYMLFAPTDEAFEALPKEELDALMADSEALADLLRAHIVEGYYPPGSLGRGGIDRTVTNLLGEELALTSSEGFAINSVTMGSGPSSMVANGNRVFLVSSLLPPEE